MRRELLTRDVDDIDDDDDAVIDYQLAAAAAAAAAAVDVRRTAMMNQSLVGSEHLS